MKRNQFLSLIGFSFLATAFFPSKKSQQLSTVTDCDDPITPPVPEGPFYKNEQLNRIDITESTTGVPIQYTFRVEDKNCHPIRDAIVDIWQCDRNGHYSDFAVENSLSQKWLRGYQKTNANGECSFTSIFPGWYDNRITHLHAKVHINNKNVLTTNFFFPKEIENEVYASPLYPKGPNPLSISQDIELKVDKDNSRHDTLLMKVSKDKKGALIAHYTIAIV
jgi:protocatechuate 3,4-dioxygenase beta subunit